MISSWTISAALAIVTVFLCRKKRYRWFYVMAKTFKRDIRGLVVFVKLNLFLKYAIMRNQSVVSTFESLVKKQPKKVAYFFEDETWTYAELDHFCNKIARYFKSEGYKKGYCVALILDNRPEYVGIWLGLAKIGVVTALINTNLTNDPLVHSIKASKCKSVIFGSAYAEVIKTVAKDLGFQKYYQFHEIVANENVTVLPQFTNLRLQLKDTSADILNINEKVSLNFKDPVIFIYTSGTTGLPKAAVITNMRYLFAAWGPLVALGLTSNDVVYTPLPLYHTAGGILGSGQAIASGVPVALRKKFSASNYWKDCVKYRCTIGQYIGEICRYLLIAHTNVEPVKHSVRAVIGNGLRPQIWKQFVERFNIKEVYEIYGATEGIANMANFDSHVGAIGFIPRYAKGVYPLILIKCDQNTGEPIRGKNGYCTECEIGEPGLLIGKINKQKAIQNFEGYADKNATEKKVLKNVFCNGDSYFNSGDILIYDELGYFYFKDRTGDTFRWKGENVSTAEVEAVISNVTQLTDAVVFGVEIPHSEGRVGMAAIVDKDDTIDLQSLSNALQSNLPAYAIPVFLRVMKSVPLTGTYKMKKVDLQAEGYNINKIKDNNIYFYDSKLKKYVQLTNDIYENIVNGSISF